MSAVLLVDDSVDSRELLRTALEHCGYLVLEAGNGREALSVLEAHPAIALVVLDLSMPVMNGYEFLEVVRTRTEYANVPIVVVSGDSFPEVVLATGRVRALLKKPVELECFLKSVAEHGAWTTPEAPPTPSP